MWWKGGGSALLDQVEQFLTGRHHTQEPELDFFCEQAVSVAPQILPWHVNQVFREAASYVDRVLRGTPPGDLPVQAPTKFEPVLNLKTARALGLDVPDKLLARAEFASRLNESFATHSPYKRTSDAAVGGSG